MGVGARSLITRGRTDVGMGASVVTAGTAVHGEAAHARVLTGHEDGKIGACLVPLGAHQTHTQHTHTFSLSVCVYVC
jgi:hypothetical protein